jgi:hypothetical protein
LKSLSEKGASFEEIKSMVDICFDALDTYGKTPEQVHSIVKLFCTVFEGYPISKVRDAFRQWVKTSNKFPTPADIEKIINPPVIEWKPDWAAYTALKRRIQNDWYYPLSDEREFLRKCEEYAYRRASPAEDTAPVEQEARRLMLTNQQTKEEQ